jgi:hypothetical protein
MSLLPRLRLAFARRPWLHWVVIAICAIVVWAQLAAAQADATRAREKWGTSRTVWVAAADAAPGEPVTAGARQYPLAMVPVAALATSPVQPVAARHIAAGAVLVVDDLAGATSVPVGWVVLGVPATGVPSLTTGQEVAIFAAGQRVCDGITSSSGTELVEVGVPPDCAGPLSARLLEGSVVLARLP